MSGNRQFIASIGDDPVELIASGDIIERLVLFLFVIHDSDSAATEAERGYIAVHFFLFSSAEVNDLVPH